MAIKWVQKLNKDDSTLLHEQHPDKLLGRYHVRPSQAENYGPIIYLEGFKGIPAGFNRNGWGFSMGGPFLVELFQKRLNKFQITIVADTKRGAETSIRKSGRLYDLRLKHDDLMKALRRFKQLNREKNERSIEFAAAYLGELLPKYFKASGKKNIWGNYAAGSIANLASLPDIKDNLSLKDKEALFSLSSALFKSGEFELTSAVGKAALKSKSAGDLAVLRAITKKFRALLKTKNAESSWQKFLKANLLFMNNSYVELIEKQNVNLSPKYPDFLLADLYGYIDIFEIKTPGTDVLLFDKSRKNYYWAPEIAKAISQVEKYADYISAHKFELQDILRKKIKKEIEIVRPRGFILAGTRAALENAQMAHDFRVLNASLRSVEIIFYDDLLAGLENLEKKLQK